MSTGASSPFFGAYNARHINAEEVADQFVPSTKFWELVRIRNSLLVGPRGSGKTHLLKMLQPKALAAWSSPEAEKARNQANFWGVFVPADVNWRAQVDHRAQSMEISKRENFGRAVFLSHVREAFITCVLQLTRDRPQNDLAVSPFPMDKQAEVDFCELLSQVWLLNLKVPSLDGVRLALIEEMSLLGDRSRTAFSEYATKLFASSVVETARQISTVFESVFALYNTRWALCFDELEIAPASIQRELFGYLRSTDQRLLFKLAISPANSESSDLNNEYAASASNDFDPIPLWFADQREREVFCKALWEKQAAHTKSNTVSPERMLARSRFQYPNQTSSSGKRRYGIDSEWAKDFAELEAKDRSFASYLVRKKIKTNELSEVSKAQRDSIVRKIAPLVGFRNAYFAPPIERSAIPKRRPLKGPPSEIFSGWDALCTATEGNPRWFCGMASKFLLKRDDSQSGIVLTRDQQAREFESSANKFLAWISAVPLEIDIVGAEYWTLRKLIDTVGLYFEESVLGRHFVADPILGFEVDKNTPTDILKLLISALNIGAIVSLTDDDVNLTSNNIVGHKFRLVHLLAPHYCLPLRSGKTRKLSTILRFSPADLPDASEELIQRGLFSDQN